MRLSGRMVVAIGAVVGLIAIAATGQIAPATSEYQAQLRVWLAARATGITAYLVLTLVVALGMILSHPVNQSTWKLSKRLFPWHENLFVFVVAFVLVHVVALVLDPYAGVGIGGAIVPGLSSYRTVPVALGNLALYALLIAALTARYTKLLPPGVWLKLHRGSLVGLGDDLGPRHRRRDRHRFASVRCTSRPAASWSPRAPTATGSPARSGRRSPRASRNRRRPRRQRHEAPPPSHARRVRCRRERDRRNRFDPGGRLARRRRRPADRPADLDGDPERSARGGTDPVRGPPGTTQRPPRRLEQPIGGPRLHLGSGVHGRPDAQINFGSGLSPRRTNWRRSPPSSRRPRSAWQACRAAPEAVVPVGRPAAEQPASQEAAAARLPRPHHLPRPSRRRS